MHYTDGSTYGEKTIERAVATTSEFYNPGSGDESTEPTVTSRSSDVEITREDPESDPAYLTEKNRLLTERVNKLEAELEQKTERIESLEAELKRFEPAPSNRTEATVSMQSAADSSVPANDGEPEMSSIWGRAKRLFGTALD